MNVRITSVSSSFFFGLVVVRLALWASAAHAIPNQALNPHLDNAADISYIQDNTKKPDETNHFHIPLRAGETISVSDALDNYGLRSNKGWVAFSAWDNNLLRFEDTPQAGDGRNKLLNDFGHGFIDPTKPPLYKFEASVPADAKPVLAECFKVWAAAAKAQIAGKTSPAGNPLVQGITFKEAGTDQAKQFDYDFISSLQSARGAYGEWVVSQDRIGGAVTSKNSMYFDQNPQMFVRAPEGYTIKEKGSMSASGVSFPQSVGWSYDDSPEAIEIDLQYFKDGIEYDSLRDVMMTTNTDVKIKCDDKIKFYQMDFLTIALHETGHILGLQHAPDDPAGNIMREKIEWEATWGKTLRTIDANSAFGAAMLYTIAVPEPATAILVFVAAAGVTTCGRCRRLTQRG